MGVQYSLWGGSVVNLGTERHKQQYFDAIDKFRLPGIELYRARLVGSGECLHGQLTVDSCRLLCNDRGPAWQQCVCSPD